MAIKLRVPDADRQRLGLPEWLEYDPTYLLLTEAQTLQEELGIDPWELQAELRGRPVLGPDNEPVMVGRRPKLRHNWAAWRFALWVAARRTGCELPLAKFDISVLGLRVGQPEAEAADDPKDPSTPEKPSGENSDPSEP